jgi:hypothetical protein
MWHQNAKAKGKKGRTDNKKRAADILPGIFQNENRCSEPSRTAIRHLIKQ